MNSSMQKESVSISKRTETLSRKGINVTHLLNYKDPKNIRQKIFDLLATGHGKLEITDQTVYLSVGNLYEREQLYAEIQQCQSGAA